MLAKIEFTLTDENVKKIIYRLINAGRRVDITGVYQIFAMRWDRKPVEANYMSDVCDWFLSDIWNSGCVK